MPMSMPVLAVKAFLSPLTFIPLAWFFHPFRLPLAHCLVMPARPHWDSSVLDVDVCVCQSYPVREDDISLVARA